VPLDPERIKLLCFDVDGTLSDTDDRWVTRLSRFLRPVNFLSHKYDPIVMARRLIMVLETPGNLLYHGFDRFGLDGLIARLFSHLARRDRKKPANFWLIPQTRQTLLQMHPHFILTIVSARGERGTSAFLNQFELAGFFRSVATSQTCKYTKPFPDPILWVAGQSGVKPEECVMVGDTAQDIRAGKSAGAQTVGVLCGFGTEAELRRAGADLILPCPYDLVQVLLPDSRK
jgi:HAD superfamily hydrolase (TIGR01509 family)